MGMTLIEEKGNKQLYFTAPDINGGPNSAPMNPIDLSASFPGIVQSANGSYTGEDAVAGSEYSSGAPVRLGQDGWMEGQSGCVVDSQEMVQNGGAGVDMPDLSWCGLNDWIGRNPVLAVLGLVALFYGTRGAASRIRARRAR